MQQNTNISNYGYTGTSPFRACPDFSSGGSGVGVVAGNVLTVFSDKKHTLSNTNRTTPYIVSTSDYDPFGMIMNGRNWNAGEYRFGFNGKEKDNETYGIGNEYDFGARIYDPRTGRFLSIDSYFKDFPDESNYSFAGNCPIKFIDYKGNFKWEAAEKGQKSFADQYPMITKYLSSNIELDIKSNVNVMNALVKWGQGGQANEDKIKTDIKWEKNTPGIRVVKGLYSSVAAVGMYNEGGNCYQGGKPQQFFDIDKDYLDKIEGILADKNSTEKQKLAALTCFYGTVLDEYTHYLDWNTDCKKANESFYIIENPVPNAYTNGSDDQGTKTRLDVQGDDVSLERSNEYIEQGGRNLPTLPK